MRRNFRLGRVGLSMLMATAILVFPIFSPGGSRAQKPAADEASGKITGTVTDNKGAGISGARVTITNVGTHVAYDVTTDDNGNFEMLALPLGSYRVGAELYGFRKALSTAHKLQADHTLKFDIKLETEGPSETVMVTATSPQEPARLAVPVLVPTVRATSPQSQNPVVVPTTVVPSPQSPGRQKDGSGAAQPDEQTQPQNNNVVWVLEPEPPAEEANGAERAIAPGVPQILLPIDRSWTMAGSTGTIDEDSLTRAEVRNFTTNLLPGQTGAVRVRYNMTAVDGMTSFCPATTSQVRIRFRDSDAAGGGARVILELHRTNINSGGNTLIFTFDSNTVPGVGSSFQTATGTAPMLDFDFANNIYWFEATITRTDASLFADLGSMQVVELAGTACP